MQFPSKLIEDGVNEIAKLPGIGKKTALRLVLHLLREEEQSTISLADALVKLRTQTCYCEQCHNISDGRLCSICEGTHRDRSVICVIESTPDLMAIENTGQYNGLYHVLGGVISPIEGVGPAELKIESLIQRVTNPDSEVKEIILALSSTMEGDTTAFYITKKLKTFDVQVSTIARGVPVGSELEYTDEITLGRSILSRTKYKEGSE
ncbi:recombination mediator RecR [Xanthovirga aplysinae]|uniref:recombination mediator RecR n=1 Tax=Xanthovirga aplysinae TaxID=2529853 RepID=UPI0012BB4B02|nr:recombination mediator RecR [Xanthovirga aplysinae]MTI33344.1 recombination protein RecR [Xanthovirga aplysinae]